MHEYMNRRENGCCPFCGQLVNESDLRDDLSRKEYQISGLCQKCQDEFFETPGDPDPDLD